LANIDGSAINTKVKITKIEAKYGPKDVDEKDECAKKAPIASIAVMIMARGSLIDNMKNPII
jgi:hypothetical protein